LHSLFYPLLDGQVGQPLHLLICKPLLLACFFG